MKTILINASNLHGGGGLQVAASFLFETQFLDNEMFNGFGSIVLISPKLKEVVDSLNVKPFPDSKFIVVNSGYHNTESVRRIIDKRTFDLSFTIFGPDYLDKVAPVIVRGFARPHIIYPQSEFFKKMTFLRRLISRLKYNRIWKQFKGTDCFVVELEHVRKQLETVKNVDPSNVYVVYNSVSSIYESYFSAEILENKISNRPLRLGIVTRDYPHKNLDVLPDVADILGSKYDVSVEFGVTLSNREMERRSLRFRECVDSVGEISPVDCPVFYRNLDGVIFPSLLECFSATPLETMVMGVPLFASNLPFISDVCREHCVYFDPLDPEDIADKVYDYFFRVDSKERFDRLVKAKKYAVGFSSPKGRARQYIEIIRERLELEAND